MIRWVLRGIWWGQGVLDVEKPRGIIRVSRGKVMARWRLGLL